MSIELTPLRSAVPYLVGAHDGAEVSELVLDGLDVGDELGDDGGPRLVEGLVPDGGPEADGLKKKQAW